MTRNLHTRTLENKRKNLKALVDTYESIQDERIRAENRLRAMHLSMDERETNREAFYNLILTPLQEMEKELVKALKKELRGDPVYEGFLKHIKGIGPVLSAKLLSLPLKLGVNLSDWNAYFGLVPFYFKCKCSRGHKFLSAKYPLFCPVCKKNEQPHTILEVEKVEEIAKPVAGYISFWNPHAKKLYWITTDQFVKLGHRGFYGQLYRKIKHDYSHRYKDLPPLRIDRRARRTTFKIFLSHFYTAYHDIMGLDARPPYPFEYLNHTGYIDWRDAVAYDRGAGEDLEE